MFLFDEISQLYRVVGYINSNGKMDPSEEIISPLPVNHRSNITKLPTSDCPSTNFTHRENEGSHDRPEESD